MNYSTVVGYLVEYSAGTGDPVAAASGSAERSTVALPTVELADATATVRGEVALDVAVQELPTSGSGELHATFQVEADGGTFSVDDAGLTLTADEPSDGLVAQATLAFRGSTTDVLAALDAVTWTAPPTVGTVEASLRLSATRDGPNTTDVATLTARAVPRPAPTTPTEPVPDGDEVPAPPTGEGVLLVDGQRTDGSVAVTPDGAEASGRGFVLAARPTGSDDAPYDGGDTLAVPSDGGIRITTQGFRGGSTVRVLLTSTGAELAELRVGLDGTLQANVPLGGDVRACRHDLQVVGLALDGRQVALSLGLRVDAEPYPFDDAAPQARNGRAIACLATSGHVVGRTGTAFVPGDDITRGEGAAMVAAVLGAGSDAPSPFGDVSTGPFVRAIVGLHEQGVVLGYTDGTFAAHVAMTRSQFLAVLLRALGVDTGGETGTELMELAAEHGLVGWFAGRDMGADRAITRGDAAYLVELLADDHRRVS